MVTLANKLVPEGHIEALLSHCRSCLPTKHLLNNNHVHVDLSLINLRAVCLGGRRRCDAAPVWLADALVCLGVFQTCVQQIGIRKDAARVCLCS